MWERNSLDMIFLCILLIVASGYYLYKWTNIIKHNIQAFYKMRQLIARNLKLPYHLNFIHVHRLLWYVWIYLVLSSESVLISFVTQSQSILHITKYNLWLGVTMNFCGNKDGSVIDCTSFTSIRPSIVCQYLEFLHKPPWPTKAQDLTCM